MAASAGEENMAGWSGREAVSSPSKNTRHLRREPLSFTFQEKLTIIKQMKSALTLPQSRLQPALSSRVHPGGRKTVRGSSAAGG